jgi:rhodanese-related sulfurtransferase
MIDHIRPALLTHWLSQAATDSSPVVLDVREPWELQTAAVTPKGFTLVAIPMNDIPSRIGELDAHTPIACLCHHGARSLRVANFLSQNGFNNVVNISGGIEVWAQELDTTVPRY